LPKSSRTFCNRATRWLASRFSDQDAADEAASNPEIKAREKEMEIKEMEIRR
jgi:hypothetical protein